MVEKKQARAFRDVPTQEKIGLARDVGRLVRDLFLIALIIFCIFNPPVIRGWLGQLGISRVELLGIVLTPGSEHEIAAAVDAIKQQRDAALFERNTLAEANRRAIGELERLRAQLPQEQGAALDRTIEAVRAETRNARIPLPPSTSLEQDLVGGARRELGSSGHWAVVYGGDPDLAGARDEVTWARANGLDNASIVLRHNSYRSFVPAGSAAAANQLLPIAMRRRTDAYVVNLDTWCPNAVDRGQYRACQ